MTARTEYVQRWNIGWFKFTFAFATCILFLSSAYAFPLGFFERLSSGSLLSLPGAQNLTIVALLAAITPLLLYHFYKRNCAFHFVAIALLSAWIGATYCFSHSPDDYGGASTASLGTMNEFDAICLLFGVLAHLIVMSAALETSSEFIARGLCYSIAGIATIGGLTQWKKGRFEYHSAFRATGLWNNPNTFGMFMACGLIVLCALIVNSSRIGSPADKSYRSNRYLRSLYLLILCLVSLGLGRSLSRGAWFASVMGLGTFALILSKTSCIADLRRSMQTRAAILVFPAIIAFLASVVKFLGPTLRFRIISLIHPFDISISNRYDATVGILRIISDYPIRGVGWGNVISFYEGLYAPDYISHGGAITQNSMLYVAGAAGIPCLVLIVASLGIREVLLHVFVAEITWTKISGICFLVLLFGAVLDGALLNSEAALAIWMLSVPCIVSSKRSKSYVAARLPVCFKNIDRETFSS